MKSFPLRCCSLITRDTFSPGRDFHTERFELP